MKNYVIIAVLILGGVGLVWFLMSNDPTLNGSDVGVSGTEGQNSQGSENPLSVTADPVATVNGEEISNASFNNQQAQLISGQGVDPTTLGVDAQTAIRSQVLDSLISQELLKQAAADADVRAPETEVDAQVDAIKGQFQDEALYEQALTEEGLTEAELRAQLSVNLSIRPYLEQALGLASVTATEEEINRVYEEAAAQQDLAPLEEIRNEVEQLAIQQKQQLLIDQHIAELRGAADVEIFI